MLRRFAAFATALLACLCVGSCSKPCDEDTVREASKAFEQRTPEGRRQGLSALEQACPSMPDGLRVGLGMAYGGAETDDARSLSAESYKDEALAELVRRTCPRSDEERARARESNDNAEVTRETCSFDRYGVLESNELFVRRDFGAFVLYEWLTTNRVDPSLARGIARGLMAVNARPEELEPLCYFEDDACERVFGNAGLAPPQSTADTPVFEASELRISLTEVAVEGEQVFPLTAGRPNPGVFQHHVAARLRKTLLQQAAEDARSAEADGEEFGGRLRVLADASVPFGTVADALFSATKAGYREFDLVVGRSHGRVASIALAPPLEWFGAAAERRPEAKPMQVRLVVHPSGVEMTTGKVDEAPQTRDIAGRFSELKQLFPHETVATFRVDADVPLQRLVSLMDTARGEDCKLLSAIAGNGVPTECLFWQPVVDLNPPLTENAAPFHAGVPKPAG